MKLGKKLRQLAARELPVERLGYGFPAILKVEEPFSNGIEVGKVIGGEDLSLNDGKVDFDLVKPAGVNGPVHQDEFGIFCLEALHGSQSAMGGSVVHDPEHASRIIIWRPSHDLFNEAGEWSNSTVSFAAAKSRGAMNIKSGQVGPRATPFVLVFDFHGRFGLCGQSWMETGAGLNAGFLVC